MVLGSLVVGGHDFLGRNVTVPFGARRIYGCI
jgi:hypothetical protein